MGFKPAEDDLAYAKIGIMGEQSSGKTRTATEIATGLHEHLKSRDLPGGVGRIYMIDSEDGSFWVKKLCDPLGIELMVEKTRSYRELTLLTQEVAETNGILIVDSISHFWRDVQEAFLAATGKKYIAQWDWPKINRAFNPFNNLMVTAPCHMIVCGRAAWNYETEENEEGQKTSYKTSMKMQSQKDTGYEASFVIVMEQHQELDGQGVPVKTWRTANVIKDRNPTSTSLDGKSFENPRFKDFLPYFEALNLGGKHSSVNLESSTNVMFASERTVGDGPRREEERRVILLDEIREFLKKHYPTRTADDQQGRADMLEKHFGSRSWKAAEMLPTLDLKRGFNSLHQELDGSPKYEDGEFLDTEAEAESLF